MKMDMLSQDSARMNEMLRVVREELGVHATTEAIDHFIIRMMKKYKGSV